MAQNCPSPADGTFKEACLHVEDFEHPFEPEHLKGFGQELIQIFTDSMFNTLVCVSSPISLGISGHPNANCQFSGNNAYFV